MGAPFKGKVVHLEQDPQRLVCSWDVQVGQSAGEVWAGLTT